MEKKMNQGKDSEAVQGLSKLRGKDTTVALEVANAADVLAQLHLQNFLGSGSIQGSSKETEEIRNKKEELLFPKTAEASGKADKRPA